MIVVCKGLRDLKRETERRGAGGERNASRWCWCFIVIRETRWRMDGLLKRVERNRYHSYRTIKTTEKKNFRLYIIPAHRFATLNHINTQPAHNPSGFCASCFFPPIESLTDPALFSTVLPVFLAVSPTVPVKPLTVSPTVLPRPPTKLRSLVGIKQRKRGRTDLRCRLCQSRHQQSCLRCRLFRWRVLDRGLDRGVFGVERIKTNQTWLFSGGRLKLFT